MLDLRRLPPETLGIICDTLFTDDQPSGFRPGLDALLFLARTSRAFHDHALNTIWEYLPGYAPLVYTLPKDAWTAEVIEAEDTWPARKTHLSVTRPLTRSDVTRLWHYNRRVKVILPILDCSHLPRHNRVLTAHTSVLQAFTNVISEMEHDGKLLLPNLRSLTLESPDPFTAADWAIFYRTVPVLYGPGLRDFYGAARRTPGDKNAFQRSLEKLSMASPQLRALHVSHPFWEAPQSEAISTQLCSFHHLTDVRTNAIPIKPSALLHLAKLPCLQALKTKMDERASSDVQLLAMFDHAEGKGYFPQLLTIDIIHQYKITPIVALLRAISSCNLQTICLTVNGGAVTSAELGKAVEMVATQRWSKSLRTITANVTGQKDEKRGSITISTLLPLFILHDLSTLVVTSSLPFSINNIALHVMAAAWPAIHRLQLGPEWSADAAPPRATLAGLIPFAHGCPQLRSLSVALNTDTKHISSSYEYLRPGRGFEQRRLTSLNVGWSPITDPAAVAAFLSDLFPKLWNIECAFPFEEDAWEEGVEAAGRAQILADAQHRENWSLVSDTYLPQFVEVRRCERRWANEMGLKPYREPKRMWPFPRDGS
ncbi:hypothetical protein C2E23DRAFT_749878 [Lenzites betulinus]|nr:hypothetical protein C2E23DRAFT_749878 [Lenzites betulinus]